MDFSLGELLLFAFIGIIFLKPDEIRKIARTAGRWMGEVQRMSREFTSELTREFDLDEFRQTARELKEQLMAPDPPARPKLEAPRMDLPAETKNSESESPVPAVISPEVAPAASVPISPNPPE